MVPMEKLLAFTGNNEGLRLEVYKCPAGKDTVGYGHNITDNGMPEAIESWDGKAITMEDALKLFEMDITATEHELRKIFPQEWANISQNRQLALIDMMFNMGSARFRGFKNMILAVRMNMWNVAATEAQNSAWYRQVTRRAEKVIKLLREG